MHLYVNINANFHNIYPNIYRQKSLKNVMDLTLEKKAGLANWISFNWILIGLAFFQFTNYFRGISKDECFH